MKKIFLALLLVPVLFLTGCGKVNEKTIKDNFIKNANDLKSYYIEGELSLTNNDDTYNYDVKVSYKDEDFFKVELLNKANNYEQTIIRNKDGVYVVTPSLNKSFKFQSEWPYNNSQIYLLQSLADDLKMDPKAEFQQKDKNYIFTTKVNYPNNPNYIKQDITIDKDNNLKKVEVKDQNDITYIIFTVKNLDKKPTFDTNHFNLDKISEGLENNETTKQEQNNNEEENTTETPTMTIDDPIFPLYLPANTTLSNREIIDTANGQRVIMTFGGDNPFILVQETVAKEKQLEIIPTYGEPFMLIDTVGSLTDISYTWTSNGIEYYIVSDVMNKKDLLEVAKSLNVVATINQK